jgi:hypothetical protein
VQSAKSAQFSHGRRIRQAPRRSGQARRVRVIARSAAHTQAGDPGAGTAFKGRHGCHEGQGYLIGRPAVADRFDPRPGRGRLAKHATGLIGDAR